MRIIDLHCYPNTEPWIKSQGPYVEALAKYWNRAWTWKSESEVIDEFTHAGIEAMLVAFDKKRSHFVGGVLTPPTTKGDARPLWKPHNFVPASRGGEYLI